MSEYRLVRSSGDDLALGTEHEAIARPRKGRIAWSELDRADYTGAELDAAASLWSTRARQEMHSLALFTELSSRLHLLGAPLDWSGAFARMIADEVRHTDLCLRLCDALGRPASPAIDPARLHLLGDVPSRGNVLHTIVAAFCIGETISGRMFKALHKAANVPLARDVIAAIVVDETFHGELGWELGALLSRSDGVASEGERVTLAASLPRLFRHFARQCCASAGPAWARSETKVPAGKNFGDLTNAGYAAIFFDGMEEDVVPGLVALGFPGAEKAYAELVAELDADPAS